MNSKFLLLSIISLLIVIVGGSTVILLTQQPTENKHVLLETSFSLNIGESATLSDQGIVVHFTNVLEDSRCPEDVECFWEGTVSLALEISYEGSYLGEYILNSSNLHKASFMGYYVKLLILDPYPVSTVTIQKSEYIGTFIVSEYGLD